MPQTAPSPAWERFYPDRRIGARVLVYREVDSTMEVAWSLAEEGAAHGTVVRADFQRMGRGRFARRWESGKGDSLLTSTVLRTPPVPLGSPIAVAGTLAVRDSVRDLTGAPCAVKWPNDVVVRGRKIAGVLAEVRATTAGEGMAVLGIGLNVNLDPSVHTLIADVATSLAREAGHAVDLDSAEEALLRHLDHWVGVMQDDPTRLMQEWRGSLETLGCEVTVHQRDGALTGLAIDVDDQGCLLLRTPNGAVHRLQEGDVTLRT